MENENNLWNNMRQEVELVGTLLAQSALPPHGDIAWRCPEVPRASWPLPDRSFVWQQQWAEVWRALRRKVQPIAPPSCTSDFQVILGVELGLSGLTCHHLRNRQPISAPFPHSLCTWVSVRIEASLPNRNIQTCLQAADWKAAFFYLLGFFFSFHELTAKSHSKAWINKN